LADEKTIKRVAMQVGKAEEMQYGLLIDGENVRRQFLSMLRNEMLGTIREDELSEGILDRDFPGRNDAEVPLVSRIE
jgi:hypothetical protein